MASPVSAPNTDSSSSILASEQQMVTEQEQVYAQEQQIQTQSSIAQSQHDTMMAVIRAIAQ